MKITWFPSLLIQFLQPLLNGCADVVLNNLDDFLSKTTAQFSNDLANKLQITFYRPDLNINSLLFPPMQ